MNTTCRQNTDTAHTPPQTRHIFSTWFGTARAWWTRRTPQRSPQKTESELTTLDGLTAQNLKDIGAPAWMYAHVQRAQDRARQEGLLERESLYWR